MASAIRSKAAVNFDVTVVFLTLFYDFLSQSRYADVKERSYTSNQDVPEAATLA